MTLSSSRRVIVLAFVLFAVALVLAPLLFSSSLALGVLAQIGYTIIICLSYNMLFGQGGMLSFGHAVYTGLGAFAAVYVVKIAARGQLEIPLVAVPLFGGFAGLIIAAILGFICTRKSGTTFAMITLGIGELVAALALMLPEYFGGEGGISFNRVYGTPFLGWTFGPQIQVYYLIFAYCLACTVLMFAFTCTPLGRMLNAVRDNAQRAEFIGYNPQRVRHLAFMASGFFAGVGGALMAIQLEIVTGADSLGMARSASYLLFTFLGGSAFFFGPIIGAVLLVCTSVLLSGITKAWLLYLGLIFVAMVMYAPNGLASLFVAGFSNWRAGRLRGRWGAIAKTSAALLVTSAGAAALIEMTYHLQLDAALGSSLQFMHVTLDVGSLASWLGAAALLLIGLGLLAVTWRKTLKRSAELQP